MLTTNKAVYGTDGSLSELGNIKGSGSSKGHHIPVWSSGYITNTSMNVTKIWEFDMTSGDYDFSFESYLSEHPGVIFLINVDYIYDGDHFQKTGILAPEHYQYGSEFLELGNMNTPLYVDGVLTHLSTMKLNCDGSNLDFSIQNHAGDIYIDGFTINIYAI